MNIRQAVPTEYAGVRFRSKSEAVFARCLHLAGWWWKYEPELTPLFCIDHQWDFYAWQGKSINDGILIEYKPSEPSAAYMERITALVRGHYRKIAQDYLDFLNAHKNKDQLAQAVAGGILCPRYLLFYGSPWNPTKHGAAYLPYPIFDPKVEHGMDFIQHLDNGEEYLLSHGHNIEDFGITEGVVKSAMEYRFDLRGGGD